MAVWSSLRSLFTRNSKTLDVFRRCMSDERIFRVQPSRFQWNKFKDLLHFYTMLGLIPGGLVILYANVFIGPATLSEIPEGYVPKYWEYYRHPISRFMAKYILTNPQQDYEKYLHHIYDEEEKRKLRKIETEVQNKMAERNDYQAYYYKPLLAKYYRASREAHDYIESLRGE